MQELRQAFFHLLLSIAIGVSSFAALYVLPGYSGGSLFRSIILDIDYYRAKGTLQVDDEATRLAEEKLAKIHVGQSRSSAARILAVNGSNDFAAYSTAPGLIVMPAKMITSGSDPWVNFVIAHELAHIRLEHSLELQRHLDLLQFKPSTLMHVSHAQEFAADVLAIEMLNEVNLIAEPTALLQYNSFASKSHPSPARRICHLSANLDRDYFEKCPEGQIQGDLFFKVD